jgi:hypothetical protein
MAVEYRGVKRPRIYGGKYSWTINDGRYGYFSYGSESGVISIWEEAVDKALLRAAADDSGNYTRIHAKQMDGKIYECLRCGAGVVNVFTHDEWHAA